MRWKRNLNNIDRALRLTLGIFCIYVGFMQSDFIANDLVAVLIGVFGLINVAAAAVSNCPIYSVTGLTTYKDKATRA